MISKHLPAKSFYHTCRYIHQKKGAEILHSEGLRDHNYQVMAEDFMRQQQMRPEKQKACFHAILSFHPDEKPSDETMKEIAQKYLTELGVVNTQVVICKHTDRVHPHLHIVANMINNDGNAISDSWIGLRGKKVAQQLTQEYQLIPAIKKNLDRTNLEALSQTEAIKYRIFQAITENLPHCRSMDQLEERLKKRGIDTLYKYKGQTEEKQGVSFRLEGISFKGSEVDRQYSLGGLQKALAAQKNQLEAKLKAGKTRQIHQPTRQRKIISRQAQSSKNAGPDKTPDFGKMGKNIVYQLLKPEDMGGSATPYELSQEAEYRRKKKKKGPRL